ncbi:MAG TPA: adenylyltransferase/cytidyltransferase family protein [Candidatus Nitrosotenuis sp.]|jgi:cytidyltransferase-like protein|nr:adenylyltransferase/cytidyltransferase family protein [Candidatus Nitrosotenuis sp.]
MTKIITYPTSSPFPAPQSILVGGCFDLLHYGHLNFLKSAKSHGKILVVALESDESISQHKNIPSIHTQQQRAEILAELKCVDYVIQLPTMTTFDEYLDLVEWIQPKIIAVTEGDQQLTNKERQAARVGAKVLVVNQLIEGLSSRLIRQRPDQATLLKLD